MYAVVLLKAAQLVHVDLRRSHGAVCSVQEPSISVEQGVKSVMVAHQHMSACNMLHCRPQSCKNMPQTCISWHDNQQGRLLVPELPASALPSGHCLDQGASLGSELQQLFASHPLPCEQFPT